MLLGCCHCDRVIDPPSESDPSSSESGSNESIETGADNCATGNCIDGVFAIRYKLTFSYNKANNCGPHYSSTTYILNYFTPGDNNACGWQTTEFAKVSGSCTDYILPRFSMYIIKTGIYVPSICQTLKRYHLISYSVNGSTERGICYSSNLTNVGIGSTPVAPINCLESFTLPIFSNATAQQNWAAAVTGNWADIPPATVTIEPAP